MSLRTWASVVAVLFPFLGTLPARQPENTSESFRKEHLEKFPWTLANTTAGDAMVLRILVESRGAKSGVEVGTHTGYGAIEYVQSSPLYDTQIIRGSMQKNDGMSVSYKIR